MQHVNRGAAQKRVSPKQSIDTRTVRRGRRTSKLLSTLKPRLTSNAAEEGASGETVYSNLTDLKGPYRADDLEKRKETRGNVSARGATVGKFPGMVEKKRGGEL